MLLFHDFSNLLLGELLLQRTSTAHAIATDVDRKCYYNEHRPHTLLQQMLTARCCNVNRTTVANDHNNKL
jgi:hypothetical protein